MKNAQMVVVLFLAMAVMGNAQWETQESFSLTWEAPPPYPYYHMIGWGRCDTSGPGDVEAAKTVRSSTPYACWTHCKKEGSICTFFDLNRQTKECNLHYDYSGEHYDKGDGNNEYTCYKMDKW